jgi:mono/diheme cytochrome c family protein
MLGALALAVATGCGPVDVVEPTIEAVDAAAVEAAPPSPSPTPVSTTAPYAEPVRALPTPVDVAGATGIVVAPTVAPTPEPTVAPTPEPTAPEPTGPAPTVVPTATAQPSVPIAPFTRATPSAAAEIANGAEGYSINCARCHSENGLGTFQASGLIGIGANSTRAGLIGDLTTGHPFTFGFPQLSAEEIAAVVAYVRATF